MADQIPTLAYILMAQPDTRAVDLEISEIENEIRQCVSSAGPLDVPRIDKLATKILTLRRRTAEKADFMNYIHGIVLELEEFAHDVLSSESNRVDSAISFGNDIAELVSTAIGAWGTS